MKNHLLLFAVFFSMIAAGQEKRKTISGYVFIHKSVVSDVHIVNKTAKQGTITNDLGFFEIPVFSGDTLAFSHLNLEIQEITVTQKMVSDTTIEIDLEERTYALDEITLEKPRSIFYIDPEIMPPPTVNATTLNLPYANTKAKKDYAIFKIKSGGVVDLDNLINALNGTHKRRKELQKFTLEDTALSKIRKQYTDDFFITDLHIKQENIHQFLNYCHKRNIIYHFNKNEHLQLTRILMTQSKTFLQKDTIKISVLNKN
ncbi:MULTISPECIES: carboxypeptidase-like regulatory domain-containing protein [unclassified Polaribacter]|uniref:carboxypeptidase-like regulatory domain-containing protein n=1 Tax=unclassified Polaribacter TaxID=196858 RepID=UPI0011BF32AA|nr:MULTISPECIES: carboxypeptidase-like regulatory domain-containing protein [unclassified Polaribacter]TXD52920.1 hypothetical protein ES043_06850 [Polaribacter sp. IC063]TXD60866.1 hypothetical protein ES044_06815 [Polaribacter sp. IC066]